MYAVECKVSGEWKTLEETADKGYAEGLAQIMRLGAPYELVRIVEK